MCLFAGLNYHNCDLTFSPIQEIKDWHLALIVLVILIIFLVIAAIGYMIPACRPSPHLVNDREHQPAENVSNIFLQY